MIAVGGMNDLPPATVRSSSLRQGNRQAEEFALRLGDLLKKGPRPT
jgi:hypothetical protein